jgi:hypothetical protein
VTSDRALALYRNIRGAERVEVGPLRQGVQLRLVGDAGAVLSVSIAPASEMLSDLELERERERERGRERELEQAKAWSGGAYA